MKPLLKYTLGRMGLFLAVFLILVPVNMNILVKLMIAVLVSFGLAFFLLRRWRDEATEQMAGAARRRQAEKDRLRSALAGEDTDTDDEGTARDDSDPNDRS